MATGYWFTSLETGSQSEKLVNRKFLSLYYEFIYILIILLTMTDHKINNHAVRQPFPQYNNINYMLPATQLQKNAPPWTTCDASPLVISRDVTSHQSSVACRWVRRKKWNFTQHAHRLHCIVSTSHAQSQTMQGKRTRRWHLMVMAVASATRFCGIVMQEWNCRCSHLVTQ